MRIHQQNWSGHTPFQAARFHQPTSVAEVQAIVRNAQKVRVIGARHSFSDIDDTTGDLISLDKMDNRIAIDHKRRTVTVNAGITYLELCPQLHQAGYALHNLASLLHITVIGACMTATHGSGDALGNLATAVSGLEMVTADGSVVQLSRQQDGDRFNGAVVAVGALGVVTKVTLDLQPTFMMQQDVYQNLPMEQLDQYFSEITSAAYSVCMFTNWQQRQMDTTWVKQRLASDQPVDVPTEFFGATLAPRERPMDPMSDRNLTTMGVPAPWYDRLPHFYFKDALLEGNELQSEYFVSRSNALEAMHAVASLHKDLADILSITEVRTMTSDKLWLSPAYGQETVGIHFNWFKKGPEVLRFLPTLEKTLAPFHAIPHWGKLFAMSGEQVQSLYPRMADFRSLLREFDPQGKFRNAFVDRYLF